MTRDKVPPAGGTDRGAALECYVCAGFSIADRPGMPKMAALQCFSARPVKVLDAFGNDSRNQLS